jgi:polar amino acid transport system substrate-binding protein
MHVKSVAVRYVVALAIAALTIGISAGHAQDTGRPAGAEKTKITDWADPRPAEWTQKYPLFGPVAVGDGSLKRVQESGIKICSVDNVAPYLYRDAATGQLAGSDLDMARHVMGLLGISKIEYTHVGFGALIPALQANRCDIVMNSLVLRSDRAKAKGVRFTTPYTRIYVKLSVRKDSPYQSIKDMKGKKIGSVTGSTDADTLEAVIAELGGGIQTVMYDNSNECYLSTTVKNIDGCMFDDGSTVGALKQYTDLRATNEIFTFRPTGRYAAEPGQNPYVLGAAGAITRVEDNDLNRALSLAFSQILKDGTQKSILQKWGTWHEGQNTMIR